MAQNFSVASVFQLFFFYLFLEKKVAKIQENLTLQPTRAYTPSQNFPANAPPDGIGILGKYSTLSIISKTLYFLYFYHLCNEVFCAIFQAITLIKGL
jgi:hypothetical protein